MASKYYDKEKFKRIKTMTTPNASFPQTLQEIVDGINPVGYKLISEDLYNNIDSFIQHLHGCPDCVKFWTDVKKEADEFAEAFESAGTGTITTNETGNMVGDDPEDRDYTPEAMQLDEDDEDDVDDDIFQDDPDPKWNFFLENSG